MSAHYTNEPAATASATLHTTVGPIHLVLFAKQAPLTCKNFLQHCKDNYYVGTIFHRIVPDFIIQGGDPTGTGSGGTSIYEYPEFEYDPEGRDPTEKVVLRDELHSRLRFSRRGMVGMAKSEDGSYGSQFFITLANAERELNGQCTLFGRVEGDSIFTVLKIAEAERVEGSERPVYPVKITKCEVGELGPLERKLKERQTTAPATAEAIKTTVQKKNKKKTKGGGKTLLSFGADEGDDDLVRQPTTKPKFNTRLVTNVDTSPKIKGEDNVSAKAAELRSPSRSTSRPVPQPRKRPRSPSPDQQRRGRPKAPDPLYQLPLPDPESPRSPHSPASAAAGTRKSALSRTNAEIEAVKASMRRTVHPAPSAKTDRSTKSSLEAMISETAIRGRRRPPPGTSGGMGSTNRDDEALKLFNAFKAKLESAGAGKTTMKTTTKPQGVNNKSSQSGLEVEMRKEVGAEEEEEEDQVCDLHFIANCQSCKAWDVPRAADGAAQDGEGGDDDDNDEGWLTHELRFGKDTLGKDLNWKREHPEDVDSLVVIDPRERERHHQPSGPGVPRGRDRDRERNRRRERAVDRE